MMLSHTRWMLSSLFALCLAFHYVSAQSQLEDPRVDPKNDPRNPLKYIASNTLTAISFSLIVSVAIAQSYCIFKWGAKWMLSMVIGAYLFAFGLSIRFGLHLHPRSKGMYILEYLFVVLAPCAFIAADYILLGRLATSLNATQYLAVPARRITLMFVLSDLTTFLIQAAGGALSASAETSHMNYIGSRIFLAGLAIQLVSFAAFTSIYLLFLYRLYRRSPETWARDQSVAWYNDWRTLAAVLLISCVGILIRSLYRVVELSEGYRGFLATNEAFFYGLDTLPLFVAVVVYIPFWPGRFINEVARPAAPAKLEHN